MYTHIQLHSTLKLDSYDYVYIHTSQRLVYVLYTIKTEGINNPPLNFEECSKDIAMKVF